MESDEALYARWIAGDLRAFDQLYARFERPLFGFVRSWVKGAEAEDVLHETFMTALRERRSDVASFRAWIFAIARNRCSNASRSQKRRAPPAEVDAVAADAPGADNQLDAHRRAATLERAVARLPAALGELYRLRAAGLSYQELAELLGVPVGTVKSRMHEMVTRLKQEVAR